MNVIELNEQRRPGLGRLVRKVQQQHPSWTAERCLAHAKALYCNRTIVITRDGKHVEIENPDFLGGRR